MRDLKETILGKTLQFTDLYKNLEMLAEDNPTYLINNLEVFSREYSLPISDSRLSLFQAKALISLSNLEEAEKIISNLLGRAVLQKDYFILVKGNILLSKCYAKSETQYRIKPCLDLAEEYASASQDAELLADALSNQGYYYQIQHDCSTALDYQLRAVKLIKKEPASLTKITVIFRLATSYHKLQNYTKSIIYLSQALEVSQEAEVLFFQYRIINNLSTSLLLTKNFRAAEELLNNGIRSAAENGYSNARLQMLYNLGVLSTKQEMYEQAILRYDQCLDFAKSIKMANPHFLLDVYNNYAVCFGMLGKNEQSLEYLNKAEELAGKLNDPNLLNRAAVNKTNILIKSGYYDEALSILQKAVKYYSKTKDYANLLVSYRNLALLYEKRKDVKNCIKTYRQIDLTHIDHVNYINKDKAEACNIQINDLAKNYQQMRVNFSYLSQQYKNRGDKEFVGTSEASKKVLNSALLAAQHPNANVFIIGESGTGKEIIANIIHYSSIRRDNPFVPVNASAIASSLMESELFGHTKGAYTGASHDTKGFFLQANKGTLFLDEITEMPIEFQAKLLRALESRRVTPVGSATEIAFDSRIISSTNRDIYEQMEKNTFRLDLFHRLNTIEIYIPPLRSRPEDIEALMYYFVERYTMAAKRRQPQIVRSFIDALLVYPFPGNVRELKNIIERLFILSESKIWDADILGFLDHNHVPTILHERNKCYPPQEEDKLIIKALIKANGKQKVAAKYLDMSESTLTRRIVKYHLEAYTNKSKNA
jgi:transcriptional regulator with PAS, ATPase and Fis domain